MATRARLIAPIALAALSAVAALSLGRLLDSSRFVAPVLVAALLPHALAAGCRRLGRRTPWAFLASAVGLVVMVVVLVSPGLPGAATWHELSRQVDDGWHLLRTAPAPAPATDGAVLLAVVAIWLVATFADWLGCVRGATLGALAPSLVFFAWTSTLGTSDGRLVATAGYCIAAGVFLVAQNVVVLDRRRSWLVSRERTGLHWMFPAAAIGAFAVVTALVVGPALPGAGSDPVVDFANPARSRSGGHSYQPSVAPFVDIAAKLDAVTNTELFTVRADAPDYWRVAALDDYSNEGGGQWTLSANGGGAVTVGLPSGAPAGTLVQDVQIGPLGERWLPAAYRPVAITLPDTLVVDSSGTIVADASSVKGLHYRVASRLPPLAGDITAAEIDATAAPVPASLVRYTRLPRDLPPEIAAEAKRVVASAGATTPFAEARALRDYFRSGRFAYDTTVAAAADQNAIVAFLRDRRGFCVQFASAFAVMARTLGIPARVAVGFTPGTLQGGRYHVSSHDAHAWPEIYLSGLGWTHLFDPTPAAHDGTTVGGSALPGERALATQPAGATSATTPPPTRPSSGTGTNGTGSSPTTGARPRHTPPPSQPGRDQPWLAALLALAGLLLLAALYATGVVAAKARRRARRRGATDPAAAVTGAWLEALDRLAEADVPAPPSLTPHELASTAPDATTPEARGPLRVLADAYTQARWSAAAPGPDDARAAWTSVDELARALHGSAGWWEQWRRRLDPVTLRRRRSAPRS